MRITWLTAYREGKSFDAWRVGKKEKGLEGEEEEEYGTTH